MNIYELEVRAMCPHDRKLIDVYRVRLKSESILLAECIVAWFKKYEKRQIFQEAMTHETAVGLGCSVEIVGVHGGVKITSIAP